MALEAPLLNFSDLRERSGADMWAFAELREERKTMTVPQPGPRPRKPLDAGVFQPEIGSFRLHLAPRARRPGRSGPTPTQWHGSPLPT
jgi:hypothetical protein